MLRLENVGLRYGLGAEIIRDATFNIAPQSFQFLTGPSGAGKTTLLRLMLLSLKPTRGRITIFDKDAATLDAEKEPKKQIVALREMFAQRPKVTEIAERRRAMDAFAQVFPRLHVLGIDVLDRSLELARQNIAASDSGPIDKVLLAELKKHRWDRTPQRWSD